MKNTLLVAIVALAGLSAAVASGQTTVTVPKIAPPPITIGTNNLLASWTAPGGAALTTKPRWTGLRASTRAVDTSLQARLANIDAVPTFTAESAGRVIGQPKPGFFFTRRLGLYEGLRTDIVKGGIRYEACLDIASARLLVTVMQQNARSGAVAMTRGSEAQLHLPGAGGSAAIRFTVDANSSWTISGDGVAEHTVTVRSSSANGIGVIELATDLPKGDTSTYTTVRVRSNADAQLYNAEVALMGD